MHRRQSVVHATIWSMVGQIRQIYLVDDKTTDDENPEMHYGVSAGTRPKSRSKLASHIHLCLFNIGLAPGLFESQSSATL